MGTSPIFDDRVEELFIPDPVLEELPKQRPDRYFGLKATSNLERLLRRPVQTDADREVGDLVRTSPLKWESSPPLFPFLAIEAKSDSAQVGFADIQIQTAFPIWTLLTLQKDLQSHRTSDSGRPKPLVWFLGYRGSDWRVYSCYLGLDSDGQTTYVSFGSL